VSSADPSASNAAPSPEDVLVFRVHYVGLVALTLAALWMFRRELGEPLPAHISAPLGAYGSLPLWLVPAGLLGTLVFHPWGLVIGRVVGGVLTGVLAWCLRTWERLLSMRRVATVLSLAGVAVISAWLVAELAHARSEHVGGVQMESWEFWASDAISRYVPAVPSSAREIERVAHGAPETVPAHLTSSRDELKAALLLNDDQAEPRCPCGLEEMPGCAARLSEALAFLLRTQHVYFSRATRTGVPEDVRSCLLAIGNTVVEPLGTGRADIRPGGREPPPSDDGWVMAARLALNLAGRAYAREETCGDKACHDVAEELYRRAADDGTTGDGVCSFQRVRFLNNRLDLLLMARRDVALAEDATGKDPLSALRRAASREDWTVLESAAADLWRCRTDGLPAPAWITLSEYFAWKAHRSQDRGFALSAGVALAMAGDDGLREHDCIAAWCALRSRSAPLFEAAVAAWVRASTLELATSTVWQALSEGSLARLGRAFASCEP